MGLKRRFIQAFNRDIRSMFLWGAFHVWIEQLRLNGKIDKPFVSYAAMITLNRLFSIPLRMPHQVIETVNPPPPLKQPPVFIIGHWRSGTTLLHNLMCQDPQFCFCNMMNAVAPEISFFQHVLFYDIMRQYTPEKRPMDNMPLSPELPQEDEFALANMSSASFYHAWIFPKNAEYYFKKYALMEKISRDESIRWQKTYLKLLCTISRNHNGRRLVSKNPVNTGRIRALLDIFPGAKFVYLYRDPYSVFPSTVHLHKKLINVCQGQMMPKEQITRNVIVFYERLLKKYLVDKKQIPAGNLVEVRYEDLEKEPLKVMDRIYKDLSLPAFNNAKPCFEKYVSRQAGYKKNEYTLDSKHINFINRHWGFFIDLFGYTRR